MNILTMGCPGGGKTHSIINHINRIIELGYKPSNVTVLSHTRVAAKEITSRAGVIGVNASTIHSLAYRIANISKEQVVGFKDLRNFAQGIGVQIKGESANDTDSLESGDEYMAVINYARANCMPMEWAYNEKDMPGSRDEFDYFYQNYIEWKKLYGMVDFSDMLELAINSDAVHDFPALLLDECFIEGTEILTDEGFKDFRNIDANTNIAQHKNGKITFTKPQRIINKQYDGVVYKYDGKAFDRCGVTVTENHNMIKSSGTYYDLGEQKFSVCKAKDCSNAMFSTAGLGGGPDNFLSYTERLHIAIQADGHVTKSGLTRFMLSKKRKQDRLEFLLNKCGIKWHHTKERVNFKLHPNAKSARVYCFYPPFKATKNLWDWFNVTSMSYCKARDIVEESVLWDGYEQNTGYYVYYSNDVKQVEFMQLVSILSGYKTTAGVIYRSNTQHNDTHCLYISTNKINTKQVATKQHYSGNVYCVTVPEGEILVRSGLNSPIVVGNCQDISRVQWKLIDKISANTKEMVVVSDRDQSLFCWGGAWPEGAEEWANRVGAEINILDQSYRVPFAPYMISVDILKSIKNRYDKTYKPTSQDGSVRRYNSIDNFDFNRVDSALILYRNHALRRKIEEELIRYNKPYTTLNGFPGLCDNKYGKAVAAWVNAKNTGQLNQHDARAIRAVATPAGMRVLCGNNILDILDMRAMEVLLIPLNFIDYYRNVDFSKKNDIKMSTIHGAKGMEHDNVILVNGMTQRVLDGAIKDPDHELMVWYVAVTRTKSDLTIIDGEGVKGIL